MSEDLTAVEKRVAELEKELAAVREVKDFIIEAVEHRAEEAEKERDYLREQLRKLKEA